MKRRSLLVTAVLFTLLAVLFTTCLFAADTAVSATSAVGTAVKDAVYNTIIPLLVAFAGSLAALALVWAQRKLKLDLSAGTEAWVRTQAENAVQLAAEKAAAKLKYDQMKLTGKEKLDMAIAALITKAPDLTREQADAYIHAALARISGEGATGDKAVRS